MHPVQPLLQPSHFPLDQRVSYSKQVEDRWQRLYYSELWIHTVYKYRALRSLQLLGSLTPKQDEQLSRLSEIVCEPLHKGLTPRRFGCSAEAALKLASIAGLDLDVHLVEVGPCGATLDQVRVPESFDGRRVALIYKLQIFGGGTLTFPARASLVEGRQLQLAFLGAPSRSSHE